MTGDQRFEINEGIAIVGLEEDLFSDEEFAEIYRVSHAHVLDSSVKVLKFEAWHTRH